MNFEDWTHRREFLHHKTGPAVLHCGAQRPCGGLISRDRCSCSFLAGICSNGLLNTLANDSGVHYPTCQRSHVQELVFHAKTVFQVLLLNHSFISFCELHVTNQAKLKKIPVTVAYRYRAGLNGTEARRLSKKSPGTFTVAAV